MAQSAGIKGSFSPSATVAGADAAVRRQRAESAAQAGVEAAQETADQEQEKKIAKEIEAKLPPMIASDLLGEVSYSVFKRAYQSVWTQIAEKRHLTAGRIMFETQLAGAPLVVRSITQREQRALAYYQPAPPGMDGATSQERTARILESNVRRLVVQVSAINGMTFPAFKLSENTREAWEQDKGVQQAYDVVQDWDPMVINHLLALINDLDQAKYYALVENLRNP